MRDIDEARDFYGNKMGVSEGRSAEAWIDFDMFGHQFVTHLNPQIGKEGKVADIAKSVDGHAVPVPHFGVVLTFDYGYPANELFTPKRIAGGGTLMCYNRHKAHANPYIHVGEQDITTHVDFSSLALAGMEVNMHTVGFTDQHHALVGLGIANELVPLMNTKETNSPEGIRRNLAIKTLLLPGGRGGSL